MIRSAILLAGLCLACIARAGEVPAGTIQRPAEEIPWADAPPTMPAGTKIAVLENHPQKEGLFTMRIKAPAGTKLPPHTHPKAERVTVLSGAVFVGFGTVFDRGKARKFAAGSFYVNPADVPHFIFMDEETVIQINGEGPWRVIPISRPRQ